MHGIETCAAVWNCPICSETRARARRQALLHGVYRSLMAGQSVYLLWCPDQPVARSSNDIGGKFLSVAHQPRFKLTQLAGRLGRALVRCGWMLMCYAERHPKGDAENFQHGVHHF